MKAFHKDSVKIIRIWRHIGHWINITCAQSSQTFCVIPEVTLHFYRVAILLTCGCSASLWWEGEPLMFQKIYVKFPVM